MPSTHNMKTEHAADKGWKCNECGTPDYNNHIIGCSFPNHPTDKAQEWTADTVHDLLWHRYEECYTLQDVADAHNASITAEREKHAEQIGTLVNQRSERDFAIKQLREQLAAAQMVTHTRVGCGRTEHAANKAQVEWTAERCEEIVRRDWNFRKLSEAINTALAAERDEWIVANRELAISNLQLREQLAAEREGHKASQKNVDLLSHEASRLRNERKQLRETQQSLVDALELAETDLRLAFGTNKDSYGYSKGLVAVEAALAKVKDGK